MSESTSTARTSAALLFPRALGAMLLRRRIYQDVVADPGAGLQAGLLIIVTGALAGAADTAYEAHFHSQALGTPIELAPVDSLTISFWVLAALIGYLLWCGLVWVAGRKMLGADVDFPQITRAVGFAHAPALLVGFALLPGAIDLWGVLKMIGNLWFLLALWVAIRALVEEEGGSWKGRPLQVYLIVLALRVVTEAAFYLRLVPKGVGDFLPV